MAGVPDYSKHANEIEEEVVKVKPDLKSVRNKFREKEPMTAEKFGIYLGGCSIPIKEISEKTIKRYIRFIKMTNSRIGVVAIPTMKSIGGVKAENGVSSKPSEEVNAEPEKIDFSNVKIEPIFEEMVDFETFSKSDFRAVKILACEAVPKSKKLLKFTLDDGERKDRVILSGIHEYYEPEELIGKTAIAIVNLPPRKMMGIDSEGMLISAVHEEDGHEGLNLLMVNDRIPAGAKLY